MPVLSIKTAKQIINNKLLYKKLYKLTNPGPCSGMKIGMLYYEQYKIPFKAILYLENEEVVGWGMLRDYFDGSSINQKNKVLNRRNETLKQTKSARIDIYVSPKFRRKGVGKEIINVAKTITKKRLIAFPHNLKGIKFYKKHEVMVGL